MSTLLDPAAQVLVDGQSAYRRVIAAVVASGTETEVLDVIGGSVSQDARTSTRWSGSLVVHSDRVPTSPADVLASFGSEIFVTAGVTTLAGVTSTVPLGVLPITSSDATVVGDGARVSMQLGDRAGRIAANRFATPLVAGASADLARVAQRVVEDRDPRLSSDTPDSGVTVGDVTDGEPYMFGGASSRDPWAELNDLLSGGGLRAYFDRTGELVVDELPTGVGEARAVRPDEANVSYSGRPANVVVVRSSISSVSAWGVWEDDDPDSATYADGPYGRVTLFADAPVHSDAGAATAARRIGGRVQGRGGSWRVLRGFDPTWDPGDSVLVPISETDPVTLAVDAVTVDFTGATTLTCRTWPA